VSDIRALALNMDETSNAFNWEFNCLTSDSYHHPVVEWRKRPLHLTESLCWNSAGWIMRPFIVLSALQHLPRVLKQFQPNCYFVTRQSGWMTKNVFRLSCVYFSHQLSFYRGSLPPPIRNGWANLLVDGHSNRIHSDAVDCLSSHRSRLIILPARTSHAIQPFDHVLAAPLSAQRNVSYGTPRGREGRSFSFSGDAVKVRWSVWNGCCHSGCLSPDGAGHELRTTVCSDRNLPFVRRRHDVLRACRACRTR
jgi:hypothetical protein